MGLCFRLLCTLPNLSRVNANRILLDKYANLRYVKIVCDTTLHKSSSYVTSSNARFCPYISGHVGGLVKLQMRAVLGNFYSKLGTLQGLEFNLSYSLLGRRVSYWRACRAAKHTQNEESHSFPPPSLSFLLRLEALALRFLPNGTQLFIYLSLHIHQKRIFLQSNEIHRAYLRETLSLEDDIDADKLRYGKYA